MNVLPSTLCHISQREERQCDAMKQARSHAVAWVANVTPGQENAILLLPLRIFLQFFHGYFAVVAKERSPKILVEINLGLCTYKKIQSFPAHTLYSLL